MAVTATQNPASRPESKAGKKKKTKSESVSAVAASPVQEVAATSKTAESSNGGDGAEEHDYIRELNKAIRNVNKKITNASKVDGIIAENAGKSLDDLVAARKINADQKAQALKKPALQATLTQLEEQIAQYKKFDTEYKAKSQAEKSELEKNLSEKSAKELEQALATAKAEAAAASVKEQQNSLLLVSQFLRLAAARRAEEADSTADENQALEGVLYQVYTGDATAVATMIKLTQGSEEQTFSVNGDQLSTTYAQIKAAAIAYAPAPILEEEAEPYASPAVETTDYPVQGDPTLQHAGLTELDAPTLATQQPDQADSPSGLPKNVAIGEGNASAESHWDTTNNLSESQEWVDVSVPRDLSETDTGITATAAAATQPQSWADEQPDVPAAPQASAPAANGNDGFQEVPRSRGNKERDGQNRGRGGRGRGRGGYRGDGRGRGRGGAPRQRRENDS